MIAIDIWLLDCCHGTIWPTNSNGLNVIRLAEPKVQDVTMLRIERIACHDVRYFLTDVCFDKHFRTNGRESLSVLV